MIWFIFFVWWSFELQQMKKHLHLKPLFDSFDLMQKKQERAKRMEEKKVYATLWSNGGVCPHGEFDAGWTGPRDQALKGSRAAVCKFPTYYKGIPVEFGCLVAVPTASECGSSLSCFLACIFSCDSVIGAGALLGLKIIHGLERSQYQNYCCCYSCFLANWMLQFSIYIYPNDY